MKNKNQKRIHQTPTIEIRGGRKVKDFRKTKILDSKENLEIDLQTDNTKEKESQSQAGILKLLERITNITLNLQREVAEVKEDILVNASHITSLRKEICVIRESLLDNTFKIQSLTKAIQDSNKATGDFVDELENLINGLENKIQCLSIQSESQAQNIEKIKFCMEVFSSHINVLEKRSEKWTDKFKLGHLKPKNIEDEQTLKQHITEINQAKTHFALNDD
ncbi:hypothetical protein [Helicobacter ganmani]|uniref:hypothetical protein n=1 Tax=Helicobacter ganmani TaxID=60246 RepID=UPI003A88C2BE